VTPAARTASANHGGLADEIKSFVAMGGRGLVREDLFVWALISSGGFNRCIFSGNFGHYPSTFE